MMPTGHGELFWTKSNFCSFGKVFKFWIRGNEVVDAQTMKRKCGYFLKCIFKRVGEDVDDSILKSRTKNLHDKEYFQAYSCVV
jgi:hypothetical protein